MEAPDTDLDEALHALDRKWNRIVEVPESPRTTMSVIEYSIDKQRKAEEYVNRLLRYFLDPEAPHGMGDDLLRAFLEHLPDECAFREDTYDLSGVDVSDQVSIDLEDSGRTGIVDLAIEVTNEWFLLVELKFGARENSLRGDEWSQTEYYYLASTVNGRETADYESGAYYLYVHPRPEPPAREPAFADWTWEAIATDLFEPFLDANAPRYPHRTVVQLRELIDDIKHLTGMSDQRPSADEKIELYLEYYDAITDVSRTFDERWQDLAGAWGSLLRESLTSDNITADDWVFRDGHSDWAHLFKDGWWRRTDDLSHIENRADGRNDVRIGFTHRLEQNRDRALGDRELVVYFRNMGANDDEFIQTFNRNLARREADFEAALPPEADLASITDTRRNLVEATFPIHTQDHDDIFAAYIAALKTAFEALVVDNEALIEIIDAAYEDAIDMYR